uniref:Glycerophosphocholine phosphodiesterase n=1 Tax=Schistosoma mansoni TaxID=6183 RepID=A0A3Q0KG47_SCHMA
MTMKSYVAVVIYSVNSKNSVFQKMRVRSLKIDTEKVDAFNKIMLFSCSVDPSLSWSVEGSFYTERWIPVTPHAASGFLVSNRNSSMNSILSVDLELETVSGSEKSCVSFTLRPDYQDDQGLLCLPVSSDSGILDEIYLYYLFIFDYKPLHTDQRTPLYLCLPPVNSSMHQNATSQPMIVGHAGAGVKRAHYGKGPEWPENTICAFRRAEQLGVTMVECDANITKDSEVVLHHNFTLGVCEQPRKSEKDPQTFILEHKTDGVVNENSTDLIVNYQLSEIRSLLRKVNGTIGCANIIQSQYPSPLTMNDPIPNIHGKEAEPIPLLKDAFYQTSTNLSFNVEIKYPIETPYNLVAEELIKHKPVEPSLPTPSSYFYKINKFCDTILDTIWSHAGPRYVILSSFNPDICLALRLKQSFLPVLFISRGGYPNDSSHKSDPRHHNIFSATSWAHIMNLNGIVTVGHHFGSTNDVDDRQIKSLGADLESKQLSCFVYGDGVSEMSFYRKASQLNLTGVIVDRLDEFMHMYHDQYKTNTQLASPNS